MNPITVNFGSGNKFQFNESVEGKNCLMEATISGTATLVDAASGHYDGVSDVRAEFGAVLGAVINKCLSKMTMDAAINNESFMNMIVSSSALKQEIEKEFAYANDSVYVNTLHFDITEESKDRLSKMRAELNKKEEKADNENGSPQRLQGMNPAMLYGMAMMNQAMNPNMNQPAPPNIVPDMNRPMQQSTPKFCTNCGAKRVDGQKFCIECGAKL